MSLDHLGFVGAGLAVVVALMTVHWLAPRFEVDLVSDRYASIDGARGLAAFFVFLCHASAWLYFAKTGKWANFPTRGWGNFGQISVVVFFMITAFLFLSKLINTGAKGMDWLRMLVSRVLRLYPLYLFAMVVLLLVVGVETGFRWTGQAGGFATSLGHWLLFTAWGAPDLNGMKDTWLVIAGVTWSLPYEVFFYLLLPVLGVIARVPASWLLVGICTALAVGLFVEVLTPLLATPFLGGAAAALLARVDRVRALAQGRAASAVAAACLIAATSLYWGAFKLVPLTLTAVAFVLIANGSTLFGLLSLRTTRLLGEVSYSMYLLHGIVLFCLARWLLGMDRLAGMSVPVYWTLVVAATPVLVGICLLTFTRIERPAMDRVDAVTASLRRAATRPALPG